MKKSTSLGTGDAGMGRYWEISNFMLCSLKNNWNGPHYQKQTDDSCSSCLECATVFYGTQLLEPISGKEKMIS